MNEANCNLTIDEAIQVSKRFLRQMAQPFSKVSNFLITFSLPGLFRFSQSFWKPDFRNWHSHFHLHFFLTQKKNAFSVDFNIWVVKKVVNILKAAGF